MKERDILHPGDQHPNGCSLFWQRGGERERTGVLLLVSGDPELTFLQIIPSDSDSLLSAN